MRALPPSPCESHRKNPSEKTVPVSRVDSLCTSRAASMSFRLSSTGCTLDDLSESQDLSGRINMVIRMFCGEFMRAGRIKASHVTSPVQELNGRSPVSADCGSGLRVVKKLVKASNKNRLLSHYCLNGVEVPKR